MQRRSFFKGVAAAAPAAAVIDLSVGRAFAQGLASQASKGLQIVGPAQDRFGHSHSLGFSTFYFKVGGSETGGGLFLMEHRNMVQGGPDLHMHLNQEEWFYVIEGEVLFQVGEQRLHLHAGESVLGPRRVPHTFSSVGVTPGRMLIAFTPAGKMEDYFLDLEDPKRPKREKGYYEIESLGPSPFWKMQ